MALTNKERDWLEEKFETVRQEIVKVQVDIATLKVRAGIWGLMGGMIPILTALGISYLMKG